MFKHIGTIWLFTAAALAVIFTVGIVVGWLLPDDTKFTIIQAVLVKFEEILSRSTSDWMLALNIFLNNLLVAVILLISGLIPLIAVGIIFANGMLIGVFGDLLWRLDDLQAGTFKSAVISLVPHGIFELSAIFLAGSFGIIFFLKLVATSVVKPAETRKQFLLTTIRWFCLVIVPLLIWASVVETFISPRVATALLADAKPSADSPYAVQLNPVALAETNCIPGEASNLASISGDQLSLLYDRAVETILRSRAKIPQWQITYSCPDGGWFNIASFASDQWSTQQAYRLIIAMLNHAQANYTEPSELVVDTKLNGVKLRYQVWTLSGRTIVITQSDLSFTPRTLFEE